MAVAETSVRERLRAYIFPNEPKTDDQYFAFDQAVYAQLEYETAMPADVIPHGVASVSNDGVSVTYRASGINAGYTQETISPNAYAILLNAGLLYGSIPRARRI